MLKRKWVKSYRPLQHRNGQMVSRDLNRLRTSPVIRLCGKELAVNACVRMEIRYFVSTD